MVETYGKLGFSRAQQPDNRVSGINQLKCYRTMKSEKSDISVRVSKSYPYQQQQFSVFLTSLTLRLLPLCRFTLRGYEAVESSCSASSSKHKIKIKHWSIFMHEFWKKEMLMGVSYLTELNVNPIKWAEVSYDSQATVTSLKVLFYLANQLEPASRQSTCCHCVSRCWQKGIQVSHFLSIWKCHFH